MSEIRQVSEISVLERAQAGWKIRRVNRWWDFCSPIAFVWQMPNGVKGAELTKKEQREMAKLGRAKTLIPIREYGEADPPYRLIGVKDGGTSERD